MLLRIIPLFLLLHFVISLKSQVSERRKNASVEKKSGNYYSKNPALISKALTQKTNNQFDVDSCEAYTFQLMIGKSGNDEIANTVCPSKTGDIITGGSIKEAKSSDYDAYIIKTDNKGTLLWGKKFGLPLFNESISRIRETSDGNFIAIGYCENIQTKLSSILFLKFNSDGDIIWVKTGRNTSFLPVLKGTDIKEISTNKYVFTGDNGRVVLYGVLSSSGYLNWSKATATSDSVRSIGVLPQGVFTSRFHIVTTGLDALGYHVGNVLELDIADGEIFWNQRLGGADVNFHFLFLSAEDSPSRPRIIGLYSKNGISFQLARVNIGGSPSENIELFNSDFTKTVTASTGLLGEYIVYTDGSYNRWNVFKKSDVRRPIEWSYTYPLNLTPNSFGSITEGATTYDGGFIISGIAKSGIKNLNRIVLLKVDSAGLIPGCTKKENTIPFKDSSVKQINDYIEIIADVLILATPVYNEKLVITETSNHCLQQTCLPDIPEDTCATTFLKNYRGVFYNESPRALSIANDGSLIITGATSISPQRSYSHSFIMRLDKNGKPLLRRRGVVDSFSSYSTAQVLTADNHVVNLIYTQGSNTHIFSLIKYDLLFNEVWKKSYTISTSSSVALPIISKLVEGDDGSFYSLGIQESFWGRCLLIKFDPKGNLVWYKSFIPPSSISSMKKGSILVDKNQVYLSLYFADGNYGYPRLFFANLDPANGMFIWSKAYKYYQEGSFEMTLAGKLGSKFIFSGQSIISSVSNQTYLTIDENGNPVKCKKVIAPRYLSTNAMTVTKNKELVAYGTHGGDNNSSIIHYKSYFRVDSNLNIVKSKKYIVPYKYYYTGDVKEAPDGSIYSIGYSVAETSNHGDIYLQKILPDGETGTCNSSPFEIETKDEVISVAAYNFLTVPDIQIAPLSVNYRLIAVKINLNSISCTSTSACSLLKIQGPTEACDTSKIYEYDFQKSNGCTIIPSWSFNTNQVKIISQTDSSLQVKFSRYGDYKLNASLFSGCKEYKDSLLISVIASPGIINLGPDKLICKDSTIKLKVPSGYRSYLWQDGSADSIFTVQQPGFYHVTTSDFCKNVFKDSVYVNQDIRSCITDLFFPNAFTPNNDQLNDLFKPITPMVLEEYSLMVFNSHGQLLFKTNDLLKGWDGTFKGMRQISAAFSWACIYKFKIPGSTLQKRSGIVHLIR